MKKKIIEILSSEQFKERLTHINVNYPNLKQESFIRNSLVELLNGSFENDSLKAFAEHPREKGNRVDLSIVNKAKPNEPFSIEFKFQFTNDYKAFINYSKFIENDFKRKILQRTADLFILIVSEWKDTEKRKFDTEWGISNDLSKFLALNDNWKTTLRNLCSTYKQEECEIEVPKPYPTKYHFFIISRN